MENVITLLPPFSHFYSIVFKNCHTYYILSRTELARLVIGERAKRARHSQVCSIENQDIYIIVRTYVTFAV